MPGTWEAAGTAAADTAVAAMEEVATTAEAVVATAEAATAEDGREVLEATEAGGKEDSAGTAAAAMEDTAAAAAMEADGREVSEVVVWEAGTAVATAAAGGHPTRCLPDIPLGGREVLEDTAVVASEAATEADTEVDTEEAVDGGKLAL